MTLRDRRTLSPTGRPFLFGIAACMAMGALSIDALLPAFPELREAVGLEEGSTAIAQVLTFFFVGIAVGQLVFGPLSDRWGRRPILQAGLILMVLAAVATTFTSSLAAMTVCRFFWGFGAAAPRALSLAMVRDRMEGNRMARTMSLLMTIFLVVPVVAPLLGSGILAIGDWRLLIALQAAMIVLTLVWTCWFPETLHPDYRRSVGPRALWQATSAILGNRAVMCFGLAATALFGVIAAYIGTAEVIFSDVFDAKALFPLLFGVIAVAMAVGSFASARMVTTLGLRGVLRAGTVYALGVALFLLVLSLATQGRPPLWTFVVAIALILPGTSLLLPNSNTAAMDPLGRIAGTGAAILGMISSAGGALLGMIADRAFNGTVTPLAWYVLAFTIAAAALIILGLRAPLRVERPENGPSLVTAPAATD